MATPGKVLFNATVSIDGTDVTKLVREVHMTETMADVDATGMNPEGVTSHLPGLYTGNIQLTAKSTFGATGLLEILRPLLVARVSFEVLVNPGPLPTTENNPQFAATCYLLTYSAIDAALGALMTTPINLYRHGRNHLRPAYT